MNSREILAALEEICVTSSKTEKLRLLGAFAESPEFRKVLEYAYNPLKTFGMREFPERGTTAEAYGDNVFDGRTWALLDGMEKRKITGNAAKDAVASALNWLDDQSAALLVRIIRKDLRAGFSEGSINKVCPGLIPSFPYCRCSLPKDTDLSSWDWKRGAFSQEKADGMFTFADHEDDGLVALRSRQGSEFPIERFPGIVTQIKENFQKGTQTHGELVVRRHGKILDREVGNGMLNSVLNGGNFEDGCEPLYLVWDQIPLSCVKVKGKCATDYDQRLTALLLQLKRTQNDKTASVALIPTKIVYSLADAYAHAGELMKLGKEGTVIKRREMHWKDGTSKDQIKLKLEFSVDLEVVGIMPGRAGTKNEGRAGSLMCRTSDGKLFTDVTVKNEKMRDEVDANPDDWIGKIIEVISNDITEPSNSNPLHSLFLPRMVEARYRTDKTVADNLERVFAQKEAAILGQSLKDAA